MKKIAITFLLWITSITSFAQTQVAVGLKGGLNFSNLEISPASSSFTNLTNYHLGIFTLIRVKKIGIQPELLLSKQGGSTNFLGQEANINVDYINLPIVFKWYVSNGFNIQAGPQFGFLSDAKKDFFVAVNGNIVSKSKVDLNNAIQSNDFGFIFGLGVDAPFGLSIEGRYCLGTSNIDKQPNSSIKNRVIQLSIGYKILRFKK